MKNIFIHVLSHTSTSWNGTVSYMKNNKDILFPNLSSIPDGKEADYYNLYSSFTEYCHNNEDQLNLCGISALNKLTDCAGFHTLRGGRPQRARFPLCLKITRVMKNLGIAVVPTYSIGEKLKNGSLMPIKTEFDEGVFRKRKIIEYVCWRLSH